MNELSIPLMATAAKMADQIWAIRESSRAPYLASRAMAARRGVGREREILASEPTIVTFNVSGVIVPDALFDDETDSRQLTRAFESAADNDSIEGGVIYINSPGGSTVGLAETVDAAKAFAAKKPLYAVVEGCCCSAAYRIASQAAAIYAGPRDDIGSIGTRSLVYDWSKAFEMAGIEAVASDTGPIKSLGVMGTEVTDEQRAFLQERVDYLQADFKRDVMTGRGLTDEEYATVATGGYWFGEQALSMKLIDGLGTRQTVLAAVKAAVTTSRGTSQMANQAETVEATKAATSQEIKSKFPNTTADFREQMTEKGLTIAEVAIAWATECEEKLEAEKAARVEAEAKAEKASKVEKPEPTKSTRGVPAVSSVEHEDIASGDAVKQWRDFVSECAEKCGDRARGFTMARQRNPELSRAARAACLNA